jgi:hypothetical protein
MKVRNPLMCLTALLICVLLAIPADIAAQAGQATQAQHAGKLTAVLPAADACFNG